MQIPTFKGIMTVVTTPFNMAGAIDFDVLGKHLEYLLDTGIHAIIPGGSTGEYYAQTMAERKRVLDFVAEVVKGRAQLLAGTNSEQPQETIELSLHSKERGYQGLMLAAPFYSLPNTEELAAHYRSIAAAVDLPIILYNFPARTGVDMNRAFLEAVSDVKAVCAIKESSGSFARMLEQVVQFDGRYQRVCGADDQAVDFFLWGARSWIAGASNFMPAAHIALYDACVVRKDYVAGQRLMKELMPLFYLLEQGGKYIQYVKYGCELRGFAVGEVRRPLQGLTNEEKVQFRKLFDRVREIEASDATV